MNEERGDRTIEFNFTSRRCRCFNDLSLLNQESENDGILSAK